MTAAPRSVPRYPENDTTIAGNTAGRPRQRTGAPLNTPIIEMPFHSRTPAPRVWKQDKHGKHAKAQRTRRHGQGTRRQAPCTCTRTRAGKRAWHSQARTANGHSWPFTFLTRACREQGSNRVVFGQSALQLLYGSAHDREPMVAPWAA